MKIYLNRKPVHGPWGGGNNTLLKLCESLEKLNFKVVFNLQENIDVIFCYDPRPNTAGEWFQDFINYKLKNPKTKIIQRVGDVGTHSKPELTKLLREIVEKKFTDFYIFPSEWSRKQTFDYFLR